MGAAMSVTAFQCWRTFSGGASSGFDRAVAIACAAVSDVTAWCILAAVVVIVRATGSEGAGSGLPLWVTLGGSASFVAFVLTLGKRACVSGNSLYGEGRVTQDMIAVLMLATLASRGPGGSASTH
jgi:Kef-type K+ transport system membrane component KefB